MAGEWAPSVGGLQRVNGRGDDFSGQSARGTSGWSGRALVQPHSEFHPVCSGLGCEGSVWERTSGRRGGGRH